MSEEKQILEETEGNLIPELTEDPSYLIKLYNEKNNAEYKSNVDDNKVEESLNLKKRDIPLSLTSRAGGIYIPPHKLRIMQEEMLKQGQVNEEEKQRFKWELLRKSINEIVNKVSKYCT